MSSSVFFRFKSQKDPQRITFDGTGISVFELKREIINVSNLGEGTDYDFAIYHDDTNEEYNDDTEIVPRSSTVIARRMPASKPGHGKAARYISGKMPTTAKNSYRTESSASKQASESAKPAIDGIAAMNNAQTEEERIAAMFQAGADQWEQQQKVMATAKRVPFQGQNRKPANVPDQPPPPGYVCHRCGIKGHWIQECPKNDDPEFDNRPRIKRTTGIPKAMLKTIEKPVFKSNDGLTDDTKQPTGIMMNAEGEFVMAVPDQATWEKFQAKAEASAAQKEAAVEGSKEVAERGLQCPIDKRLFVDPVKTPCCGKTYCHDCIENALLDGNLTCPNCLKEGVLLDDLTADEEMVTKIKEYEDEKVAEKKTKERSKSPAVSEKASIRDEKTAKSPSAKPKSPSPASEKSATNTPTTAADTPAANGASASKRKAEDELKNDRVPTAPAAMRKQMEQQKAQQAATPIPPGFDQSFIDQMNQLAGGSGMPKQPMNMNTFMAFPGMNGGIMGGMMGGMPNMSMPGVMGMPNATMNPMMMQPAGRGGWNPNMNMGMNGMGFPQNGMYNGYNNHNNNMMNGYPSPQNWQGGMQGFQNMNVPTGPSNMGGGFPNQQRSGPQNSGEEDSAYFRQPVNPHRHQNRRRGMRPSDYTQV